MRGIITLNRFISKEVFVSITVDRNLIKDSFAKYAEMLLRVAYQNVRRQAYAEDVVQDVFVRMQKERQFNDEQHIKSWLIRVTIHKCYDFNKSAWESKTENFTEQWAQFSEEQTSVFDELSKLPDKQRNVIYLYYYEGYSIPEIAKILKESQNTVSSRLTRARAQLKTILTQGGYENE